MIYLLSLLLTLTAAFANLDTDRPAINEFSKKEFYNPKNYAPEGKQDLITKEFHGRILKDPKLLRYFFVSYVMYQFDKQMLKDPEYKSYIKKKFGTPTVSISQQITVKNMLSNLVYSDTEEKLKTMLSDEFDVNSLEYFKNLMKKLDSVSFK